MTTLKVNVVRRPQIKVKVLPNFPSEVFATSPILLSKVGGNYTFSFDQTTSNLSVTIDAANIISGTLPTARMPALTGDITTVVGNVATTLATVNSNVGTFGSATQASQVTVNGKGLVTAATNVTVTPAVGSVTGFGTGIATFLATPSSANLRAAITDEVGTGAAYFVGGALGTPASGTATNLTGLPLSGLTNQAAFTFVGNNTSGSAAPTAVDIAALTTKGSPAAGDFVMLSDQAASGAWKKAAVSTLAAASGVASVNGSTGAVTFSVVKQIFTASGTYTPTTGMDHAIIECVGSGAGGGGTAGTAGSAFYAGGGGAGSYAKSVVSAATVGASQVVTVGNAGTGGATGNNAGTSGADVSVGSLCIGKGGSPGNGSASGSFGVCGAGGIAGTGDITFPGGAGSAGPTVSGATVFLVGGAGGDSSFGFGGRPTTPASAASTTGVAGSNYGAGGSGAQSHNTATTAPGGNGSKGVVFITEFVVN